MTTRLFPLALILLLTGCATVGDVADRAAEAAREATGRAVERETAERVDGAVDGAFSRADDAVRCVVTDEACIRRAEADGRPVVVEDEDGDVVREIPGDPLAVDAPSDFVAGTRVLFEEDFSSDNAGDFPRRFEFVRGEAEVVRLGGDPALRLTGHGTEFRVVLPETLPQQFTLEMTLRQGEGPGYHALYVLPDVDRATDVEALGERTSYLRIGPDDTGIVGGPDGTPESDGAVPDLKRRTMPIRLMADGDHMKVYAGSERVANIPNADFRRTGALRFFFYAYEAPFFLDDLRIAAGGRNLYDALTSDGRAVLEGVRFETGSATLTAASRAVLDPVAATLRQHADLRLRIEGHTDSEGAAESNRALSERRAAAVLDYLAQAGVERSRLTAVGRGEAAPVASNDTEAGRRQNRRVELVRQ